jgi:putative membrane protein
MMDFSTPRRQHPLGMAILSVQFLVNLIRSAWPALIPFVFSSELEESTLVYILVPLTLVGVGAIAGAIASYWRFNYRLEDNALIVEKGVLQRERLRIPLEKIQAIHLFKGPLQQAFGLTGLRVDTAGSAGSELQLVAVSRAEAESLQALLASQIDPSIDVSPEKEASPSATKNEGFASQPLVELNASRLIKVGLTQNHLRNAFLGMAVLTSLGNPMEEVISSALEAIPPVALAVLSLLSVALFIPGVLLFLLSGILISLVLTTLKYFRFRSALGHEGVQVEMGLLRRNAFQVPFAKIHMTTWKSHWLRRQLGFETLQIRQAQASNQSNSDVRVFVPAMESQNRKTVEEILYPDLSAAPVFRVQPVRRLRWLIWIGAWLPSLLLFGLMSSLPAVSVSILWLAVSGYTSLRRFRSLKLQLHKNTVTIERGWFWQSRTLIKLSQLQGIQWRRHVLLERRGVGHLTFHTAAGPKAFTYLRKHEAMAIRDYALNQLHSAQSGV